MSKLRKIARRAVAAAATVMVVVGGTAISTGTAHADATVCHWRAAVDVSGVTLKPAICILPNQSASLVTMVGASSGLPSGARVVFAMNKVVNAQAIAQFFVNGASCNPGVSCSYTPWSGAVQPGNYYNVSMSWVDASGIWHGNVQSPTYWLS
ncbi:hypothetical protein [Streptomyces sp. NPDC056387]|uniref:hypothetical protein n=1 Tax=Streptomyces sp. NPDC056387 TaxID=3345803 RepID=UPI0035E380EF